MNTFLFSGEEFILGQMKLNDEIPNSGKSDALDHFLKGAKKGDLDCILMAAILYYNAPGNIEKSIPNSIQWFKIADQKGSLFAKHHLGLIFVANTETQNIGIRTLVNAADLGYAESQFALGAIYLQGELISKDETQAFFYIWSAAKNGHIESALQLGKMYMEGVGVQGDDTEGLAWKYIYSLHEKSYKRIFDMQMLFFPSDTNVTNKANSRRNSHQLNSGNVELSKAKNERDEKVYLRAKELMTLYNFTIPHDE